MTLIFWTGIVIIRSVIIMIKQWKRVKCLNPNCENLIVPKKEINNVKGEKLYCSWECGKAWTPYMEAAYSRVKGKPEFGIEESDNKIAALKKVLEFLNRQYSHIVTKANIIGVDRKTFPEVPAVAGYVAVE